MGDNIQGLRGSEGLQDAAALNRQLLGGSKKISNVQSLESIRRDRTGSSKENDARKELQTQEHIEKLWVRVGSSSGR